MVDKSMSNKWDKHFINLAFQHAQLSKDPSTRVGAVIVGPDRELISAGFNGLPRGIEDTEERLTNRDLKLKLIIHAEMNAMLAAAKLGIKIKDCTMYIAATDSFGNLWGGSGCSQCTKHIIQSGIKEVVSIPKKNIPSKWAEDLLFAEELLKEAGIIYREINYDLF